MSYLLYKFDGTSTTIHNYGSGGSGFDGQIGGSPKRKEGSVTLTAADDRINVSSGILFPNQHTWQAHLVINQFWPVLGVVDGVLRGNDGKLWAAGNDTHYGYIHQEGTYPPLQETDVHHFSVEIETAAGASEDACQFYLGVSGQKPVRIYTGGDIGYEGGRQYWDFNYDLKIGVDYFFQVSINLPGTVPQDYTIGNCATGCSDGYANGFPCGCTLFSWREDATALNLASGGNWAEDIAGGTPSTPAEANTVPFWNLILE
jgi:hypothetical protein